MATTAAELADLIRLHRASRGLTDEQIQSLTEHVEVVRFDEECVVHEPSELVEAILLVVAGRLRLSVILPGGREKPVSYVGRDSQFGLLGLAQDDPYPVRVIAEQQAVLLRIPREAAERLLHELPLWSRNLMQSLGPQIRDSILGKQFRKTPRFVVLIHTSPRSRHLTALLTEQLTFLGETVALLSDHEDTLATQTERGAFLLDSSGQLLSAEQIRKVIGAWPEADRVFLDVHLDLAAGQLIHLMSASEVAYCFCSSDSTDNLVHELGEVNKASSKFREKINVVRVLAEDEPVASLARELAELCQSEIKVHWNGRGPDSPVCTQRAGLDRVIHHLRGVSIGLALGGGAARGMAHLGVLQVLEEAGITIDRMSGTSAGALTGILYAAGYSAQFLIESFARDLKPGWLYRMLPYGDAIYMLSKYRLGGWDSMLRNYLQSWRLEQLPVPFSAVAADLISAETVVRRQGDAVNALLESINLPGIARPICRDGQALVDGGVFNVVPADVLADQGANVVIASDVAAKIPFQFAGNTPDTPTERMKVPSGAAALVRMRTVQDRNIRSIGGSSADIVIEPDTSTVQVTDFKRAAEVAQLGRAAAQAALPDLRQLLREVDPQLFAN